MHGVGTPTSDMEGGSGLSGAQENGPAPSGLGDMSAGTAKSGPKPRPITLFDDTGSGGTAGEVVKVKEDGIEDILTERTAGQSDHTKEEEGSEDLDAGSGEEGTGDVEEDGPTHEDEDEGAAGDEDGGEAPEERSGSAQGQRSLFDF